MIPLEEKQSTWDFTSWDTKLAPVGLELWRICHCLAWMIHSIDEVGMQKHSLRHQAAYQILG